MLTSGFNDMLGRGLHSLSGCCLMLLSFSVHVDMLVALLYVLAACCAFHVVWVVSAWVPFLGNLYE